MSAAGGLRSRIVAVVAIAGGMVVAVVMLVAPVHADFGDDPVLRLQGFDRQRSFLPTTADCGAPVSNLADPAGSRTLYQVARDDACHRTAVRRFWLALAAGAVLVAAGLVAMAALRPAG